MTQLPTQVNPMAAALDRLWAKFLPEIQSRVTVLAEVAEALRNGEIAPGEREAAHAAAHKLAGSLGTFGLQRGTEIAREAELGLAEETETLSAEQLGVWVAELQAIIDGRA